ncbi:hypothetical protein BDZ94DRAFT_1151804 [Collybia nuda]|uniref:Uncharacterized protein n=1 Tax=Collybia nuda TaxID=64659 RepID=A0A9P5YJH2_9AGAR|nr:hypothetical protein BDZ94DRAFT_1151804 [Collybia nuda]
MSHKSVRTHSHASNRAKPEKVADRKVVFKSVLDSPFRIQWPSVPVNVQNSLLSLAIGMLDGVAIYHSERSKYSRKRKHIQRVESKQNKRQKLEAIKTPYNETTTMDESSSKDPPGMTSGTVLKDPPLSDARPRMLEHLVVGINEITRRLEALVRQERLLIDTSSLNKQKPVTLPTFKTILVCYGDIDPPLLVDHLPHLVAAYNSSRPANIIKLIPLPKGSEVALAQATGLPRAAAIAIDANFDVVPYFATLLDTVPTLTAPWLSSAGHHRSLIPTHIKQIRTSAPKDIKVAKELRAEGKASAKQRRQSPPAPS